MAGLLFSLILGADMAALADVERVAAASCFPGSHAFATDSGGAPERTWGSVWKMSGNVLDVRYKLLSRQLECLNHLHASLQDAINSDPDMDNNELKGVDDCLAAVERIER